jgi:hypothetical protein
MSTLVHATGGGNVMEQGLRRINSEMCVCVSRVARP